MAASRRLESGVEEVSPLREGQSEKLEKEAKDIQGVMPDGGGGEREIKVGKGGGEVSAHRRWQG